MYERYQNPVDLNIAYSLERDFNYKSNGYDMRYVKKPTCKHKAYEETPVTSNKRKETCCKEIDRSLLRYDSMIASGELKPHLCFSCMDCNDQ